LDIFIETYGKWVVDCDKEYDELLVQKKGAKGKKVDVQGLD